MPFRDISTLSLARNHLELVRSILGKLSPATEVWAYGSRVNGDGHEASDLDLVVRNQYDLNAESPSILDLKEAFIGK